jgi:hypothetical protein
MQKIRYLDKLIDSKKEQKEFYKPKNIPAIIKEIS